MDDSTSSVVVGANVEFMQIVRHSLLAPVTGIVLWCDMLRRNQKISEELDRALTAIDHSARAQVAILDNVVELMRMQSGVTELCRSEVDMVACIEDVARQSGSLSRQREVDLKVEIGPGAFLLQGDPVRLRAALHNVVDNAVTFSARGGQVIIGLRANPDSLSIRVSDAGRGIPKEALRDLFKLDPISEEGLFHRRGGLGLGLPVARWIVQLHGGSIAVESNQPRGCAITVALPT
ncbi:MAG TPA: HAMP domain-containing sensor histidine kinase [Polyangia bacterium]|jgi:signal transduction histidine kinase|nr:HAMP domain-containing sensor histidine kinase [Polyangia bacterium]